MRVIEGLLLCVALATLALAQQVQFRDGGTWWDTEIADGTYSTSSFNAWVSVQTSVDQNNPARRVLVKFTALDAEYKTLSSATVIAIKQGFDAQARRDNWQAELRLGTYSVFQTPPAEVMVEIVAEVGITPGGSKIVVSELQNPYFLVKSVNARNPVRVLPEFTKIGFDANEGPFLTGVVRVWDPNPLQLSTAVVEVRYTTDKWATVKSAFGTYVQSNIHDFEFRLPRLTKSSDVKDFVEEVEFAVRFVNSARVEIWDNNGRENFKRRILPTIGSPNPPISTVLQGETEVSVVVDQDSTFTSLAIGIASSGSVSSWTKSNSLVVDTSAVSGDKVDIVLRATVLGAAVIEKTFTYRVSKDGISRKSIKLPELASDMWLLQAEPSNDSSIIMSSKAGLSSSKEYIFYDVNLNSVISRIELPGTVQGQVLTDKSDRSSLYVYTPGKLVKLNSGNSVIYEVNLSLWSFCFVKSVEFTERFVLVMDSCDPQVFLFDKRTGALVSRLDSSNGLPGQFLDDLVVSRDGSIYIFNNNQVVVLNPTTYAVQRSWTNSLGFFSEVAIGNDGMFWTYNGGLISAFTLENGKIAIKARYQTAGRVLVSILPGPNNSVFVLDAQKKELLQFSLSQQM